MPTLPVYNSNKNINATPAAPFRNEVSKPFEDTQKVVGALQEVTQKWSDANDVMQYTEAKAKYGVALADVEARAIADPDFKNSEKYSKEIEAIKKDGTKLISNQQVAGRANFEFEQDAEITKIKISAGFQKKQMAYNQLMVKSSLDSLMQKKLGAVTPAQSGQYQAEIQELLATQVQSGVLSYEEADKLLTQSQETSVKYEIYADTATSEGDSRVLNELKDHSGKYSFLAPDTRLKMIEESQRRIFQNNQTFKREVEVSQDERTNNFIYKLADGTATFRDIDAEYAIPEDKGGMPRKVLDQYQRRLQSGVTQDLNQMIQEKDASKSLTVRAKMSKQYNDLIDMFIDNSSDRWKAKEALAKAYADGVIDAKEQKTLAPLKESLKDIQFNRNTGPMASAIKSVKKFMNASNATDEELAYRIKQLVGEVGQGKDPIAESKKIMGAEMLRHFPDYNTYSEKGQKMIDRKSGKAYLVYPDGSWEWAIDKGKTP